MSAEATAYAPRTFALTRADLLAYAEASGDHNPIHQSDEAAAAVGLPGVIAHGMLTMGLVASAVSDWTGGADVLELATKFTSPVVVPAQGAAEVTVAVKSAKPGDGTLALALEVTCGDQRVLGNPRAVVRL
ncbi:MaoC/PaaZ C-terminal domain-containing protein [Nocardioides sp. Kera G14]|uniref:MaoC/PaaZ C-terminal domain-containing protein n=1 Tax=Nocardioides sp. Kera G14 TaxID=2884264 RepID=UPI001D0FCEF4|nr:MaoC/PaaZ C-terminal domain-containing protein [Nocardioides sp. Kera G14]UDY23949.1 acyl dehydratase [Nocardioides sp. Kera G14]